MTRNHIVCTIAFCLPGCVLAGSWDVEQGWDLDSGSLMWYMDISSCGSTAGHQMSQRCSKADNNYLGSVFLFPHHTHHRSAFSKLSFCCYLGFVAALCLHTYTVSISRNAFPTPFYLSTPSTSSGLVKALCCEFLYCLMSHKPCASQLLLCWKLCACVQSSSLHFGCLRITLCYVWNMA